MHLNPLLTKHDPILFSYSRDHIERHDLSEASYLQGGTTMVCQYDLSRRIFHNHVAFCTDLREILLRVLQEGTVALGILC